MQICSPRFATVTKRPTESHPRARFGTSNDSAAEYNRVMALHAAGIALAKADDGALATQKLNEAIGANNHAPVKFLVANSFAEGVTPGLPPNPARAHEILQDILKTVGIDPNSNPTPLAMGETYLK